MLFGAARAAFGAALAWPRGAAGFEHSGARFVMDDVLAVLGVLVGAALAVLATIMLAR
jgi:hypothetical protein